MDTYHPCCPSSLRPPSLALRLRRASGRCSGGRRSKNDSQVASVRERSRIARVLHLLQLYRVVENMRLSLSLLPLFNVTTIPFERIIQRYTGMIMMHGKGRTIKKWLYGHARICRGVMRALTHVWTCGRLKWFEG